MDDLFVKNRQFIYGLEFIRSEMELRLTEAKIKNPNFDGSDAEKKIEMVAKTQTYLYELYETIQQKDKEIFEFEFLKKKLIAENIILTNKNNEK